MTHKTAPPVSSLLLIRALGLVALLSGVLVVLVFQLTQEAILANRQAAIAKAVFQVLPGAVQRRDFILIDGQLRPYLERQTGTRIYAGYDASGNLVGVAAEAAARGYQDVIRLLYGYKPACECITGIHVLQMAETPGLGDKIARDAEFLRNFVALDSRLTQDGAQLAQPILCVKHGRKTQPWQIDAISGATISSKAVGRMLNDSAQALLPPLKRQLALLQEP